MMLLLSMFRQKIFLPFQLGISRKHGTRKQLLQLTNQESRKTWNSIRLSSNCINNWVSIWSCGADWSVL